MGPHHTLGQWLGRRSNADAAMAAAAYGEAHFAEAERLCQRVLERQPANADALRLRGLIALRRCDFPGAARYLEQAVKADPDRLDLLLDFGEALSLCGRVEGAAAILEKVASAQPATARQRALVANALLWLGREDQARAQLAAALESDPDDPDARAVSARLALNARDWNEATRSLRLAIRNRPHDPALMSDLALALLRLGQNDEAEAQLHKALSLAPAERGAQIALAELLEKQIRGKPDSGCAAKETGQEAELARDDGVGDAVTPAGASSEPFISVIICSIDTAKFAAVSANYAERLAGHAHEIIGIHDAKSLCEGYNRGARQSRGDIVIFSHDDIEILTPDFGRRLKRHLARHDVVGPCGTSRLVAGHWMSSGWPRLHGLVTHRYPKSHAQAGLYRVMVMDTSAEPSTGLMQALDGLFIAVNRRVLDRCRFDEQTFDGFHLYDLDFTFAAFQAGFDVAVFRDIAIIHETAGDAPGYEAAFQRYRERFESKYAADIAPRDSAALRFVAALFDTPAEVRRFCEALLQFRRASGAQEGAPSQSPARDPTNSAHSPKA